MTEAPDPHAPLLERLRRRRARARAVLAFEALWPALWPAVGVAGLFLCLSLLNLFRLLPPWPHALLLAGFALAALGLLLRGLLRLRWPDPAAADRRLERASGLRHRPLAVLADRPATGGGDPLWRAHVARAAAQVGRLRIGLPRPGLAARDRRGLRGGLVVALAAALVIAGGDAPARLLRAFAPGFPERPSPPAPLLQAWVTPPAYTGVAPLFLRADGPSALTVPAGSHLTVSVTGGTGEPSLVLNGHPDEFRTLDANSFQAERDLTGGGRLSVRRQGRDMAAWDLTVVADQPPMVRWSAPPGPAAHGLATHLPWEARDDYGVTALQAELRLRDRPDAAPLTVTLPLPAGAPKAPHGVAVEDLAAHPWAGLGVSARLVGRDAAGQTGTSAAAEFELPARDFANPVARALVLVRRMLTLAPDRRTAAIEEIDRLSNLPELFGRDTGAYLNLRAIASLLYHARQGDDVGPAQARMWTLALHMEEGLTERTARALEQARQAMKDALDKQATGEQVDPKTLEKLAEQLQKALREHLQALAQEAAQNPEQAGDKARDVDPQAMENQAEQIREAARQGKPDEAREHEKELEKMMEALKGQRPPDKMDAKESAQRQKAKEELGALQDMVQRQGKLLDHTQQRGGPNPELNRPVNPFEAPSRRAQPRPSMPADQAETQRRQDARVQAALRRALGELMQQVADLTGNIPKAMGDAERAMQEAGQALVAADDKQAGSAQQRAVEALQKGGKQMAQDMAQMMSKQSGKDEKSEGAKDGEGDPFSQSGTMSQEGEGGRPSPGSEKREQKRGRRDPLGRLTQEGTSGSDESSEVRIPDQIEQARSRAIELELRRRGAERERPKQELDYIDRLLRQF